MTATTTVRRRRAACTTCRTPLVKGSCPAHGQRNRDGSALVPSPNKGRRFPAEPLTREELAALLRQCSQRAPTGIRNAAMIATLYRSGIRCAELLALKPKDVDRSAFHLQVLHGKGDKRRTAAIDPDTVTLINRWLDTRKALGISGHRPLFCTLEGHPLDASYLRRLLPRLARKAGVHKRVHPHGLRHTLAYEWAMEGKPVPLIQQQLGHSNAAVTARYIQHVAPADVVAAALDRPSWLES